MEELKPNEQRSKNAIILIWIVLVMDVISIISSCLQYDLLKTASNGGEISQEFAASNDLREQVIAIIYIIVSILSAITFIQWFRRAYYNLHLKVNNLSHTEGWAAGSWFVPIINLFRPYQIMKELFQETNLFLKRNDIYTYEHFSVSSLGLWWTLWIIARFVGQFVFKYSLKAETIDELIISTIASMVENCVGIFLAIITVRIIEQYSSIELLLHKEKTVE